MTPLVDFAVESLLCLVQQQESLPCWFIQTRRSLTIGNIIAFDVTNDDAALIRLRQLSIDGLPRILDRFYVWAPRKTQDDHQDLLDTLFELSALDFESIIRPAQNCDNIFRLLLIIQNHYGTLENLSILDFGCGSGVSAQPARHLGVNLVGYDRSPAMRELASKRGLRVLDTESLSKLQPKSFDAAFASYVFHFEPSSTELKRLKTLVRQGGVIVANFHKDHGLVRVTALFEALGATTKTIDANASPFKHGSYRIYVC